MGGASQKNIFIFIAMTHFDWPIKTIKFKLKSNFLKKILKNYLKNFIY